MKKSKKKPLSQTSLKGNEVTLLTIFLYYGQDWCHSPARAPENF